ILAYFKEYTDWSLISFLKFRKDLDNFTGDKATEHFNYRTALERIILLDASNHIKAKESLFRFEWGPPPSKYISVYILLHVATRGSASLGEKSSKSVEKFWTTTKMESIKLNYSMYALDQTIHEKKEIHSIITDGTIADINQVYQCKENSSYQNNNFDESPMYDDHDESYEIDNFFKSPSEKKSSTLFLQKKDNSAKRQQKSSNERGSNEADDEKDKVESEACDSIFISEENDDSGFFSLGSQPISFCDTEGLANLKFTTTKVQELPGRNKDEIQKTITDGSENKPFLVSEEE
ncbi:7858_t:CDS:2, partial [Funneliformis mosseae]